MRFVNAVTAKSVSQVRRRSSACELTSMATTVQPASRIRANSFCKSGDSGVVRSACSMTPAILLPTVPMTPQRLPATLAMCSTR